MARIRILPDILANKIAAGEVVERPASVVKELVENALDAGGTRILIDIENGGRNLIRVADNGTGMSPDDALLAMERFATSKIHTDDDLFAIRTLGFRGEALPSVAAVAKMTLVTREQQADSGIEVRMEGGKILHVREAGAPPGTMISVAQLFFNTPARRKFLKSVNTEMGHIADKVAGMALGHPQVQFKLTHNAKTVRQWQRVTDPAERVAEVLGQVSRAELIFLQAQKQELKLLGYLGPARLSRSTSRGIYLYVNGRRVHDRTVQHALFDGFSGRLMKGRFPLAVLFLELPFDQVDVNVHPTKHEIRFADQRAVHGFVRDQVAIALTGAERRLWHTETPAASVHPHVPAADEIMPSYQRERTRESDRILTGNESEPAVVREPCHEIRQTRTLARTPARGAGTTQVVPKTHSAPQATARDHGVAPATATCADRSEKARPASEEPLLWAQGGYRDLTVIGQFHGTYIICQDRSDLILIDQHAAHERIVYEQLKARSGRIESQRLLLPETLELGFAEAGVLDKLLVEFDALGLEVEAFGGNTYVVKAIPVQLDDRDIGSVLVEIIEKVAEIGFDGGLAKVLDECRMVLACHNAVRAKQYLTDAEIKCMLEQLDRCENTSHCPHGRPIWIRQTIRDLEKAFRRI